MSFVLPYGIYRPCSSQLHQKREREDVNAVYFAQIEIWVEGEIFLTLRGRCNLQLGKYVQVIAENPIAQKKRLVPSPQRRLNLASIEQFAFINGKFWRGIHLAHYMRTNGSTFNTEIKSIRKAMTNEKSILEKKDMYLKKKRRRRRRRESNE